MEHQLYCGAAKRCITPDEKLLPDLTGLMNQKFGGVLKDLYVRVLALKNGEETALFVVFELDKAPQPERYLEALQKEFGVREEHIFLTAVHTHAAPVAGCRPFEGPNDLAKKPEHVKKATHAYEDMLTEKLLEAAREAIDHLVPAKMGFATTESYINVDRKQWYEYTDAEGRKHRKLALGASPASPVDRTVYVVKFEDLEGRAIAFWVNYPVHCCVLHTNKCCNGMLGISSDLAGMVSGYMEEAYPDAVALWCSGAAGDINPVMQNEIYYPDPETGDMVTFQMPNGDVQYLLTLLATNHFDDIRRVVPDIRCGVTDAKIAGRVAWVRTPGVEGDYEVRLHMMKLGELVLIGGSGEFYSAYAQIAKNLIPKQHVILINHDASLCANSGYIIDEKTLLAPEVDLPGVGHTNMTPGSFERAYASQVTQMYQDMETAIWEKEKNL